MTTAAGGQISVERNGEQILLAVDKTIVTLLLNEAWVLAEEIDRLATSTEDAGDAEAR